MPDSNKNKYLGDFSKAQAIGSKGLKETDVRGRRRADEGVSEAGRTCEFTGQYRV